MIKIEKAPGEAKPVPIWRKAIATLIDGTTAAAGVFCLATGLKLALLASGPQILLWPLAVLSALVAAYFWIGQRHMGGTLCQRLLRVC